jgi:nucleotide-binding universal stress UspA family protein
MLKSALVAIKTEFDSGKLLSVATSVLDTSATVTLVSLVRVGSAEDDESGRIEDAEAMIQNLVQELNAKGFQAKAEVRVIVAAAGHEIVKIADEIRPELIVIGLGKRTRVGKALLGSDAQRVIISANCPVLVVDLNDSTSS